LAVVEVELVTYPVPLCFFTLNTVKLLEG